MKAIDSKKSITNKIKKFAKEQNADYTEVDPIQNQAHIVYITFSSYNLIFNLDAYTCYKHRYGDYVWFTDEELKFLDLLDFEISKEHHDNLGQNVTDWYGKKQ